MKGEGLKLFRKVVIASTGGGKLVGGGTFMISGKSNHDKGGKFPRLFVGVKGGGEWKRGKGAPSL